MWRLIITEGYTNLTLQLVVSSIKILQESDRKILII